MAADNPPQERDSRGARWAPGLALGLGLAGQAAVGLRWIRLDQSVCEGVFPDGSWPFVELLRYAGQGLLGAWLQRGFPPDLFSASGLPGWRLAGDHPDGLMVTMLLLLLLCQLLVFDLGRRLGGPWAGVLAALLLPLAPDSGAMARRWAAQLPHMLLLAGAAHSLLLSRSFSRPMWTLAFTLWVTLGMTYSPWLTDDLLFLGAAGSMALAAGLRGVLLGRGPDDGPPLSRARVLAVGSACLLALTACTWLLVLPLLQASYYVQEASAELYVRNVDPRSGYALAAYLRLLWRDNLGPVLSLAGALGLGLYAWRGRGRAELLGWLLLPLLVLSAIPKKNSYYAVVIYPVIPLVTALGLARIPWAKLRWAAMAAPLVLGWWSWQRASLAPVFGPPPRLDEYDPAFQTVNPPRLEYRADRPHARALALLEPERAAIEAAEEPMICTLPEGSMGVLALVLGPAFPDAQLWDRGTVSPCGWLLIVEAREPGGPGRSEAASGAELPPRARAWVEGRGLFLVGQDHSDDPDLWLLRRESP